MEILDLRHLRSRDLEPLLAEESALWLKEMEWDYTASASLVKRYLDAQSLPGYAAVEQGKVLGYCFFVLERYKGVIGDVFAMDAPGAPATEAELLSNAVETLKATPGVRRIEAQLMTLRHPLPAEYFTSRNLTSFRRQFMVLPLDNAPPLLPASSNDVRFEQWNERWASEAAELIARAYRGHIDSSISDQYRSEAGALRFLDNIVRYPGCGEFDPKCSFLAFGKGGSELCGMALSSIVARQVSHITQVCVYPETQRAGIGRTLMGHIIETLRDRKSKAATLTVTSSNRAAIGLYEQLNFSVLREFEAVAWDAPDGDASSIFRRVGQSG